jgi:uncharacterized protein YjiS (DUF1127 family)
MTLLSAIAEKVAAWRRYRKTARDPSRFSDDGLAGYRYWTE